jgi:hypothetical protein
MVIEFAVVVAGARLGGLEGAGVGWLVGYSLSVLPFVPTIYRVAIRRDVRRRAGSALVAASAPDPES